MKKLLSVLTSALFAVSFFVAPAHAVEGNAGYENLSNSCNLVNAKSATERFACSLDRRR